MPTCPYQYENVFILYNQGEEYVKVDGECCGVCKAKPTTPPATTASATTTKGTPETTTKKGMYHKIYNSWRLPRLHLADSHWIKTLLIY